MILGAWPLMQWKSFCVTSFHDLHHHVAYAAEHEHFVFSANVGPH
jgi:hypothetical protein